MTNLSFTRALALLGAALLLTACGGGESEPLPPTATAVAAGQQASQTLGVAGGALTLTTREGAVFTLTVPAGAVPEGTSLSLETAEPADGRRLHLRLLPAGLVPAQPLVLTMALPPSLALDAGAALVYDRAPVPFKRLADGRLELRLSALASSTGAGAAAAGRARALSARILADGPALPCSGVPVLQTTPEGGLADSAPIVSDDFGRCMVGAVDELALSGQYTEALRLASATAAYLQSIGADNASNLSTVLINQARGQACTAYGRALDTVASATITDFYTLPRVVQPLLYWQAAIEQLGGSCPGIPPTRYAEVIEELTTDALVFFSMKRGAVVDAFSVEYTEAVATVRAAPATVAQVRSLQASAPVQALAQAQLQERAQPAVVDAVLQAPWQRCRDSGHYDKLMELMQATGGSEAVKSAAQYCGTQLAVQSLAADSAALDSTQGSPLGGTTASALRSGASLQIDAAGRLVLQGPIRALGCPVGVEATPEALELRLNGQLLQSIPPGPYLTSALTLNLADALRSAGIDAAGFTTGTLTLHRAGSPCSGFWGAAPSPLLTLTLERGRSVVLVFTPGTSSADGSDPYVFIAEYKRLLEAVYGAGRVTLGDWAEGTALLRSGRDLVLVSGLGDAVAVNWVTEQSAAVRPWLEAGGRLLLHEFGLGPGLTPASTPFGIGVEMVGSGGYQYTFTVSWAGGRFSNAAVLYAGASEPVVPSLLLAANRVTGSDLILAWDDDQADGYTDNPLIFPVNYDTVGQGTAVAGRRDVGRGSIVVTTMTLPWKGYQGTLDPLYTAVLRKLRAP